MKLTSKTWGLIVSTATLACTATHACELHAGRNAGFGFNHLHPLAQLHYQTSSIATLSVKHIQQLDVAVNEVVTARISYVVPREYRDVSISFEGSENVAIESDSQVALTKESGVYHLTFSVNDSGASHISIQVSGINDGQPFSTYQKIELHTV